MDTEGSEATITRLPNKAGSGGGSWHVGAGQGNASKIENL